MTIKGGALEFDLIANNGQINSALDETKKRIQGFTDATVRGGEQMEQAFQDASNTIDKAFKDVDTMAGIHKTAIQNLEKEYGELGEVAAAAFAKGTAKGDNEYQVLTQKQAVIKNEITTRQGLLKEIEGTADALLQEEVRLTEGKKKADQATVAHVAFRTQLRNVREELLQMEQSGAKATDPEKYRALQEEAGRLAGAISNVNKQTQILGHNQALFQGIISGISGVSGAFSAAQGTVALFAGENENLQKIMLKVQSLMAITIGLQQVSQALHEKSAFSIKVLGGIRQWWAGVVAKATIAEVANTAATGAQAVAATAGTAANIGLAGAFRLVGTAIKSIPVFGWILAGVSALIALVSHFSSKAREAKKAAEEFRKEVVKLASKPVAAVQELAFAWEKLGNSLEAKKKFVEENAEKFRELGVAVNSVEEAENLLKNGTQAFINSEIAKAKATAARAQAAKLAADALDNQQKLEEAKKTPTVTRYVPGDPMTGIGGYTYEVANPLIAKLEKEGKDIDAKITQLYTTAANSEIEGLKLLEEAGIKGTQEYAEGTLGAIENAISLKQAALKLLSDPEAYKEALKEIEALQKQVEAITGGTKKTAPKKTTDPFVEMLDERKKKYQQYLKWVNSGDEIVRNAAKTEFAGLLAEGRSYLDYLKQQREQLLELSNHTPAQLKNLAKLNDEIAAETKSTVLGEFEKELQRQFSGARSIMEMLNILEERRKQLSGDGSDLDTGKSDILSKAQEDVAKKAEDETNALLQNYSAYLQEKINFDLQYGERRRLLEEKLSKDISETDRRITLDALAGLEKDREKYARQTGNEDYDKLVEEFRSYSQRRADISAEFDEKIALATEQSNQELVDRLIEAKNRAVSSVALEELQASGAWDKLFGNLDDLTTKQIDELIAKIEGQRAQLGIELDPKDLEAILSKLEEAKGEIRSRNPFRALKDAITEYGQAADKEAKKKSLTAIFHSVAASADLVKGAFDSVVGGLEKMGLAGDEETQKLLGDISDMVGAAGQLAQGIATGNPLDIIQGGINLITSAFEVFNAKDRRANREIKRRVENLKELQQQYDMLERAVDKALGGERYTTRKAELENLKKQQSEYNAMAAAERNKKKSDKGKIEEYTNAAHDNAIKMLEIIDKVREDIIGGTAASIANDLGNAFIDAFAAGENALDAFKKKADDVVAGIIRRMLIEKLIEQPIGRIIDKYSQKWLDDKGNFIGYDAVMRDAANFGRELNAVGTSLAAAMDSLPDEIKKYLIGADGESNITSLSGAIKGASQESIDLLAGQTNAVRINQVEGIEIMRNQLLHLASIDAKIGFSNHVLQQIEQNTKTSNYDPLRSQGLTN